MRAPYTVIWILRIFANGSGEGSAGQEQYTGSRCAMQAYRVRSCSIVIQRRTEAQAVAKRRVCNAWCFRVFVVCVTPDRHRTLMTQIGGRLAQIKKNYQRLSALSASSTCYQTTL